MSRGNCLSFQPSVTNEGFVHKEIKIALDVADKKPEETIFIIPARLDEDLVVPERLSQWYWVNLYEESGYRKLVHALHTRVIELGLAPMAKTDSAIRQSLVAGTVKVNLKDSQKYVWIPAGTFQMGCSEGDSQCSDDEKPMHKVTITKGFWLGQTPVTQAAYQRVMRTNPSHFKGEQLPVERVTWDQAKAYCEAVGGRLPTEAEWEYAAKAGSDAPRYGDLNAIAWYRGNSESKTHEVGKKKANRWGLYDMLGNVWEWVRDWYESDFYNRSPSENPTGPTTGQSRVVRGGSWDDGSRDLRSSYRFRDVPDYRFDYIGFRCALEVFP